MVQASEHRLSLAQDSIRRLLRRGASPHITNLVNKLHASDVAHLLRQLELDEKRQVFELVGPPARAGEILSECDPPTVQEILEKREPNDIAAFFQEMDADDVTDIIGMLPEEQARSILDILHAGMAEPVTDLLRYDEDTAGGIMTPHFLALEKDASVEDAIKAVRKASEAETVFYIYVVDDLGRLEGVISLRQLLLSPPTASLKSFMRREVYRVRTDTHQEEVARLVSGYNLLAVPVVDEDNKLEGIVTVDDVIDVLRDEATEDILKMAGTRDEEILTRSAFRVARYRLPWLLAGLAGGIVTIQIIGRFTDLLSELVILAAFMPVILGMGGNVGSQAATIVVRGIATGRLDPKKWWQILWKQLRVGALLALTLGVLLGILAYFYVSDIKWFSVTVGAAISGAMIAASVWGAFLPLLFHRLQIDPAVATQPFVSTTIDIVSSLIYFSIAAWLLL